MVNSQIASALYQAVCDNTVESVELLVDQGADVNYYDKDAQVAMATPLRAACAKGELGLIQSLIVNQAEVFAAFGNDSWCALHSAAEGGHDDVWKMLLEEAEDLHDVSLHNGFSLMHILMECANPRLVDCGVALVNWVLRRRFPLVDVNARSKRPGFEDWTPLHMACAHGKLKLADCLIKHGAEVTARTGNFHVRSGRCNAWVHSDVKGVCLAPTDVAMSTVSPAWFDSGLLPIHVAALGGHLRMMQGLARHSPQHGLNVVTLKNSWTPLMFAVWGGEVSMVEELLRTGARTVVNSADCSDAEQLCPLAIAVAKRNIEMVNALVAYGGDPLIRLHSFDFPGQIYVDHVLPILPDAHHNKWSGADGRISLLHIATVRGHQEMIKHVLFLMRAASKNPVGMESHRAELLGWTGEDTKTEHIYRERRGQTQWSGRQPTGDGKHKPRRPCSTAGKKATPQAATTAEALMQQCPPALFPREIAHQVAHRAVQEGLGSDPIVFTTTNGWSAPILAVLLHTVDHNRAVRAPLLLDLPDTTQKNNDRSEAFLELLAAGSAFCEGLQLPPPPLPQRFADVSEMLIIRCIDELVRLCRVGHQERASVPVLHASLCEASHYDRRKVAAYLLERCGCDPRCHFIPEVASRPLHIATSFGHGFVAQLLLDHKADAGESDKKGERPIQKLARFQETEVSRLEERVKFLEAKLKEQMLQ